MRTPLTTSRRAVASLLATALVVSGVALGFGGSASAVLPPVVNDPPAAGYLITTFSSRDFISASGFADGTTVDVQVWRNGTQVGTANGLVPQDDPATPQFDGIVDVNHPGANCWTGTTPDIQGGDIVKHIEHIPATATTEAQDVIEQSVVAGLTLTPTVTVIGADTVQVRGTAVDAVGAPIPVTDIVHDFISSSANPFDASGTRRISADSTGANQGTIVLDPTDPTGATWVATYTGLSAADVDLAVNTATSSISWLGRNPGAGTEGTSVETGVAPGPQAPCTAPLAGPAASAAAASLFTAATVGVAAGVAPTNTIVVTNQGLNPLGNLLPAAATTTGDFVITSNTCTGAVVPVGGTCRIAVAFTPTATGTRTGTLSLTTNSIRGTLNVSLVGAGVAAGVSSPRLFASTSALNFGTLQPLLATAVNLVTFTNLGNATATLSPAAISGTNAAEFTFDAASSNCGATLAPNAACTTGLVFTPTASGARSATLTLAAAGAGSATVALTGTGLVTTGINEPPVNGISIIPFPARDFISTTGMPLDKPVIIQLLRHNVVVGFTDPFLPDPNTGLAEVNHPGGACWVGVTPNIRGGDEARLILSDGTVYQALVANLTLGAPTNPAPGVIQMRGTADIGGVAITPDLLSAQITGSSADPFDLNGRRRITAPADGLFKMDPISVTNPAGLNWTATWSGLSDHDVTLALSDAAKPAIVWLGRGNPLAEQTITEYGLVNGPQAPCAAPAAADDPDLAVTPGSLTFPNRQAPRTGFAGTSITKDFTVKSNGLAPLRISSVSFTGTNGADFSETAFAGSCPKNTPIAVGSSCTIRVKFAPLAATARSGLMVIKTNVVGTNTTIALSGRGTAAAAPWAIVTPNPVSFAERGVNLSTTSTFTVKNEGEANLTFAIPTNALQGANAGDFAVAGNTCPANILPNASCTVTIRFRPLFVGTTRSATLNANTNNTNQATVSVGLVGSSLSNAGFNDPPKAPVWINVFPVRDYVFAQGFEADDFVTVQVVRAGVVVGEAANIVPRDDPGTPNFDGIIEVNHLGGACWAGVTPDIQKGDLVRTIAFNGLGAVQVRNGFKVQDETISQDIVITQPPVATNANTVVVKGYANDMLIPGSRIPVGSIEVRLTGAGATTFDANGRSNIRASASGVLDGTVAYDGTTNMWTATYTGLSAADVALATDPTTRMVAIWRGRAPVVPVEGTHYEWGEIPGPQPPCDAAPLAAPTPGGIGTIAPQMPGILGVGGLVDFGVVNRTATSATRTITLTNTGVARMQVSSIVTNLGLDTTNFVVAPGTDRCTGVGLDPGVSCTVGVQFAPPTAGATVGSHSGSVIMYSNGADSPHQTVVRATVPAAPTITSISPVPTAPRGGTVTINGTGLSNVTSIRFVGTNSTAGIGTLVTPTSTGTLAGVAAGTSVWAVLPSNVALNGTYKVRVTTLGGTVDSTQTFTAFGTPPTLTSFTPTSGAAGTTVTITGTGFMNGLTPAAPIVTSVTFGGVPAVSFTVVSNTSITAVTPAGGIDGRVQVTTSVGTVTSVGVFDAFGLPTVLSAAPNPARPGSVVTLAGAEFLGLRSLTLNGVAILGATVNATGTAISFTLPLTATNGVLSITARGGVGTSTLFQVDAAPTITSFTPTSAGAGVGAVVTITGRNFVNVTDVSVSALSAPFTVVNANTITFTVPAGATTGRLAISTLFGKVTTATNFTVIPPPTITAFTPTTSSLTAATTGTRMTIAGTNMATATSVTLFINGTLTKYVVTTFVSRAATSVVINTPAGMTPGTYLVRVDTPGGFAISPVAFRSL